MAQEVGELTRTRAIPHTGKRRSRRFSIASMLLLAVVAATAPLVGYGIYGANRFAESARQRELERLSLAAMAMMADVDREVRAHRETAEVLARSRLLLGDDLAGYAAHLYAAKPVSRADFLLVDARLRPLIDTRAPPLTALPAIPAAKASAVRPVFATGVVALSDLVDDPVTGVPRFGVSVPVRDGDNIPYVLVVMPWPEEITRVVQEQEITALGWFGGVLDASGRIVARSSRHQEFYGRQASPEFIASASGSEGQVASVDLEGRHAITAYRVSPQTGWRTIVWAPEEVLLAPARESARFNLGIGLLALMLSLGSAGVLSHFIRRPLIRAHEAARALQAAEPVHFAPSRLREADRIGRVLEDAASALAMRESALAAAEERLRLAQRAAAFGIIDWDIKADRAEITDTVIDIFGEEAAAWRLGNAYRGFMSLVHPADRARVEADHRRLRSAGGRFTGEYRILRRGETRWINATGEVFFRDGNPARLLGVNVDITERKQAEIGLRDRDATLALALDAAYAIAFTWDIPGDVVTRLHSSEPALPANRNDATRLAQVVATVHPDDRALYHASLERALAHPEGQYRNVFRIRRPDGEVRWFEERGRVSYADDGAPLRLVGVSIDVTERRATEELLAERVEELSALYAAAPIGLALLDREMRFLRVNEYMAKINGVPAEAHFGRVAWEIIPGMRARLEPEFRRVLETGAPVPEFEVAGETAAAPGVLRYWSDKLYPLKSRAGETIGVGVVVDEITGRKQAERLVARYAAVAVAAHDALIGFDAEGRIETWNAGAERLFGWTLEEVAGRSATFLTVPGASHPPAELMAKALAGTDVGPLDVQRMRKDGQVVEVSVTARPMRDADGRVIGIASAVHDISDRRRREAQMRFVMRELTHRSKNLLAVIQAMARQTARSSNDATEFVDRFADRLAALARSHDLLVSQDWTGVELHALVRQQLAPFLDEAEERVGTEGPDLVLKPEVAQSIGMAFHELATNASKYGALSVPGGHVEVSWSLTGSAAGDSLRIEWREIGGPPFSPPTRRGFGRTVVERMIAAATGGETQLDWRPEGVYWRLDLPRSCLAADGPRAG